MKKLLPSKNSKKSGKQPGSQLITEGAAQLDSVQQHLQNFLEELETQVGGRDQFLRALASSKHPAAKKLLTVATASEHRDKDLSELVRMVSLSPEEMMSSVGQGQLARSALASFLTLADGLPAVLAKSIEVGTTMGPDGYRDRELLARIAGLLKDGAGFQINVNQQVNTGSNPFEAYIRADAVSLHDNPLEVIDAGEP